MEFFKKAINSLVDSVFEDSVKSVIPTKNEITNEYCPLCDKTCNAKCYCRCHESACQQCDDILCDMSTCRCKCHKVVDTNKNIKVNPQPEDNASNISISLSISNNENKIASPESNSKAKAKASQIMKDFIEPDIYNNEPTKGDEKDLPPDFPMPHHPNKNKLFAYYAKVAKNKGAPFIKFKSKNNQKGENALIDDRDKLNVSSSSNHSSISKANNDSFRVDNNSFNMSMVKRRVEKMKFKDLLISNSNNASSLSDDKLDKQLENKFIPINPSTVDKSHLYNSFDLNNSKLYHGKSQIVQRMEDLERELQLTKNKSKEVQVLNVIKGFECQEAWQMYNSLIFANPSELPESSYLKKHHEKEKSKRGLSPQSRNKKSK